MDWARILAYITGTVDQELLLRNEYLVAENRIRKMCSKFLPYRQSYLQAEPVSTILLNRLCALRRNWVAYSVFGRDTMLEFKNFHCAQRTLAGIELIRMLKKGQMRNQAGISKTPAELFYALAA